MLLRQGKSSIAMRGVRARRKPADRASITVNPSGNPLNLQQFVREEFCRRHDSMKSSFAGIGALALAATPLCAIPLALPSNVAQAKAESIAERAFAMDRADHDVSPTDDAPR
ncbi:hypothetical protein [Novosphingobium resinovorum]|jgi:hypothetical protein|uniref:hypothetical protein n=2 Tax=Sphingomonadaceae TaxID=41297 RepID=UPI0022F27396|nr:hypothetical protein [Novosphingobium resinovorum]GLK46068.1 hypothetical protein GCM10017612_39900 [Novosphingobium resinovorum]